MGKLRKDCVERYTKFAKHVADLFNRGECHYNGAEYYRRAAKLNMFGLDIVDKFFSIGENLNFNETLFDYFKSKIEGDIEISTSVKKRLDFLLTYIDKVLQFFTEIIFQLLIHIPSNSQIVEILPKYLWCLLDEFVYPCNTFSLLNQCLTQKILK